MKTFVTQDDLDALFVRATAVRVHDGGAAQGKLLGKRVLLELGSGELAEIRARLRVQPPPERSIHCMCYGTNAVELLRDRDRIGLISLHHGHSIRVEGYQSDAQLADGEGLIRWLATRGVAGPLAEWERMRAQQGEWGEARRRWEAAAPRGYARFREQLERGPMGLSPRLDDAALAAPLAGLREAYPDPNELASSLLRWFGNGMGPWTGYPAYEQAAEALLRALPFDDVLAAMLRDAGDDAALAGTARLITVLAYWKRRADLRRIPEELRERALEHTSRLDLGDNLDRLLAAFREPAPIRALAPGDPATAAIAERGPLSSLCTSDGTIYALDGAEVVRFSPGQLAPQRLATLADSFHRMVLAEGWLYLLGINTGVISRLHPDGGEPIEIARDQRRPLEIHISGEAVWWLNQPFVRDPATGYSTSHTELVTLRDRRRPKPGDPIETPQVLTRFAGGAWSLCRSREPYWMSGTSSGVTLQRLPDGASAPETLARIRFKGTFPRLVDGSVHVAWFADREVFAYGERKPKRLAKLAGDVVCMTSHGGSLYAVVKRGETAREIVAINPHWRSVSAARYEASLPDRTEIAADDTGVYWTTGDQVLAVPLPKHPSR